MAITILYLGDRVFSRHSMEIFLQWLDELDDLVFAAFSIWLRLRRLCLAVAMIAAIALHAAPRLGIQPGVEFALAEISLAALAVWAFVAALSASAERTRRSTAISA
jgi:hypothetical protein